MLAYPMRPRRLGIAQLLATLSDAYRRLATSGDVSRRRIEKLEAALKWALEHGAYHAEWLSLMEFRGYGCGCCSAPIEPPEEIRDVVLEISSQMRK